MNGYWSYWAPLGDDRSILYDGRPETDLFDLIRFPVNLNSRECHHKVRRATPGRMHRRLF